MSRMALLGAGGAWTPVYLLRDDFSVAEAAPLASPRTASHVGTLTLVQVDGQFSIAGGELAFPVQASPVHGDQAFYYAPGYARLAGRTVLASAILATVTNPERCFVGWGASASGIGTSLTNGHVLSFNAAANAVVRLDGTATVDVFAISTDYHVAVMFRSVGVFWFIKGGNYTNWTLMWVLNTGSAATMYPLFANHSASGTLDTFRVIDLPAPFDTDYGLASQRIASPIANDTIASTADAFIEFTWTAVTGETLELSVRRTDDDNRWIVRGDQAGSTVKLIEEAAGVETERASAAQTWTNGTPYRVVVVQQGDTIVVYVANVWKWAYASASFNNTATGVKTNKAGTDLAAFPRTLTGAAGNILDAAVN